jgi:predicted dehydrogenase
MRYDLTLDQELFVYTHARALTMHPEFKLVGAVDLNASYREAFEKNYAVPAYSCLKRALAEHIADIVVIATPTSTHCDTLQTLLSFSHPRVILCEKPVSYSISEARLMLDLCANKGVALYVNYMRRSEPGAIQVKHLIENGSIKGAIKGVAWYSKGFLHSGSHSFNLLEFWLGRMRSFAIVESGRTLADGDAEPDVRVCFENGEVIFLAAQEENFSHNTIELLAANGRLRYENGGRRIDWAPASCDENLKGYNFLTANPEQIPSGFDHYQWYVANELASVLRGADAHVCDGQQGLTTLEAMFEILRSRQ